jgi:hypothetical protein
VESAATMDQLSRAVTNALENADLEAIGEYLDPHVRWGAPDDPSPPCQTKEQVLEWYAVGYAAGVRANVTEVVIGPNCLVVGLIVRGSRDGHRRRGRALRWQELVVRDAKVVSIAGFETRAEALAHAGLA